MAKSRKLIRQSNWYNTTFFYAVQWLFQYNSPHHHVDFVLVRYPTSQVIHYFLFPHFHCLIVLQPSLQSSFSGVIMYEDMPIHLAFVFSDSLRTCRFYPVLFTFIPFLTWLISLPPKHSSRQPHLWTFQISFLLLLYRLFLLLFLLVSEPLSITLHTMHLPNLFISCQLIFICCC